MKVINDGLKCICLICFRPTDRETLKSNDHCCKRAAYCHDKYREIRDWERGNFGNSFIEQLSHEY